MIEVNMQCSHLQVVVLVLRLDEPPADVTRLVVIDVSKRCDALTHAEQVQERVFQPLDLATSCSAPRLVKISMALPTATCASSGCCKAASARPRALSAHASASG